MCVNDPLKMYCIPRYMTSSKQTNSFVRTNSSLLFFKSELQFCWKWSCNSFCSENENKNGTIRPSSVITFNTQFDSCEQSARTAFTKRKTIGLFLVLLYLFSDSFECFLILNLQRLSGKFVAAFKCVVQTNYRTTFSMGLVMTEFVQFDSHINK